MMGTFFFRVCFIDPLLDSPAKQHQTLLNQTSITGHCSAQCPVIVSMPV